MKQTPTSLKRANASSFPRRFRPKVELLESRLQPGETFGFGFLGGALASTALDLFSLPLEAVASEQTLARVDRPIMRAPDAGGGTIPLSPGEYSASWDANLAAGGHGVRPALVQPSTRTRDLDVLREDLPILPGAIHRLPPTTSSGRKALDGGSETVAAGIGAAHSGTAAPWTVPGATAGRPNASGNFPFVSPLNVRAPRLAPNSVAFDPRSGAVLIRGDGAGHTIQEGLTARGFLDVTLDGQPHSSDPTSAAFDPLLAGATAARVTGIQLDGGQDTLTLGAQQLAGDLQVNAPGATVVTQDLTIGGSLTIEAADITVRGTLQAGAGRLAAAGWVNVQDAGRVVVGTDAAGGRLEVFAAKFVNTGQLHADGATGGRILVEADNILNAGRVTADGSNGAGGTVQVSFTGAYLDTAAASTSADGGNAGPGGRVRVSGGSSGRLFSSGRQQATGGVGGAVDLLGREVVLDGGAVDASGENGGGSIRVGGDFHGGNPTILDSLRVTVTAATTIRADSLRSGAGGRVAVWADQETAFQGTVSARGGSEEGPGGLIEVSSKGQLSFAGTGDAGAPAGKAGRLLLDPKNLIISWAPVGVAPQFSLVDPHPTVTTGKGFGSQTVPLSTGNVVVANPSDDFGGRGAGAVYLYNGETGALISALIGSNPNDAIGAFNVTLLNNGNFLVASPIWGGTRGSATWGSGTAGVSGTVSSSNSLVGANANDRIGSGYVTNPGIVVLPNGNYVVSSPAWNGVRGAVTWGSGTSGIQGVVSAQNSLVGTNPNDTVGEGIVPLTNGSYAVESFGWNGNRGAVTWGSGIRGVSGPVSAANSLVGSAANDLVGATGITTLSNGNYIVGSYNWNGRRGAVTWGSGTAGVSGVISAANSLVGANPGDLVGADNYLLSGVVRLANGNYVVRSPAWNGFTGAATWGSGTAGISGVVSATNSLVGAAPGDAVGNVTALPNGNYVVASSGWSSNRGAVTWGNGTTGVTGVISASNSLVGSNPGDSVGGGNTPFPCSPITVLANSNYTVISAIWNNVRGAVSWGSGTAPITGVVAADNSLVGSTPQDRVGGSCVTPLANGNYVVNSPGWNGVRGAATWGSGTQGVHGMISSANSLVGSDPNDGVGNLTIALPNGNYVTYTTRWNGNRGAATWGDGGTGLQGTVSADNSLVGTQLGDQVGFVGITILGNGNYTVVSPYWNESRGAVTWGSATHGVSGAIAATNSLLGLNPGDRVGYPVDRTGSVVSLANGNYVVLSPYWGGTLGAATWADGATGVSGTISADNSLVGTHVQDFVGTSITLLTNGNYVIGSYFWEGGRGAATWGSDVEGVRGTVSSDNSLIGTNVNDSIGVQITALTNGNYVVRSYNWNANRGAVTWGSGTAGVSGVVSAANSLVGSNTVDRVGIGLFTLSNGDYLVDTPNWANGMLNNAGAVTWASGTSGQTLDGSHTITLQNSLVGLTANTGLQLIVDEHLRGAFLAVFPTERSGRIQVGLFDPNQLTYARGEDKTVTITPDFLTATLDTGTAVVLQASNDITVEDPITVNAGGHGGALTLQAGRSILLNASITTDNGPLTLIANDTAADGAVDSQRDPGDATIVMAGGTALDTGTAPLDIALRDGAGLSHADSRAVNLQALTAGAVRVVNDGPDAGSDIRLGAVTTNGPQSYSAPHGLTTVTADLTTTAAPITFTDSVVVNNGVNVDAGSGTVNFTGDSTQTLQAGADVSFSNLNHTGSGTLQLTGALAVSGTLLQSAGTFDAADQPVTVGGAAVLTGGTYLAGTAPQTFAGGLVVTDGTFTSSAGAMLVRGGVTLTGGTFGGQGSVDQLVVYGGTVAPGTDTPGVLRVAGAVAFNPLTTFSVLLDGPHAGRGYSQLWAAGPINLGGSVLQLVPGLEPPLGRTFKILTAMGGVQGTFAGLPEGAVFDQGGFQFQITYHGGAHGRDVVLTRIG